MPRTSIALKELTQTIRLRIPFDELDDARVCSGLCIGCPKKLLEYLEQEVEYWEGEITRGETPTLGDVKRLARSATKIEKVLVKNQVL
ncbi:hypothetical protein MED297_07721 [Reinekea sp. MED297]|uniref:Uncharacterized protein n=2 Tax=Reinekea TaxID=230494 RepID=A4BKK7_9GAMM|nr:hypothetical protein MED297_07721 [Reinekea sp. MED297] [Reinekea blandensis MED297]